LIDLRALFPIPRWPRPAAARIGRVSIGELPHIAGGRRGALTSRLWVWPLRPAVPAIRADSMVICALQFLN